jgi:hypothetical protein
MKALKEEIEAFEKVNKGNILHTYKVGGQSGYYTLEKYNLKGAKLEDVSTSPKFTKRKGVASGTLQACRYAWLISQWR